MKFILSIDNEHARDYSFHMAIFEFCSRGEKLPWKAVHQVAIGSWEQALTLTIFVTDNLYKRCSLFHVRILT